MNCNQLESYLDRLMDDTLSGDEMSALNAHASTCDACQRELKSARQLKAMLAEMAPEVEVPLEAQGRWRAAVRQEAARSRRRVWYRYAGGVAAALVVLLGIGLLTRPGTNRADVKSTAPIGVESVYESGVGMDAPGIAMIETDGAVESRAAADAPAQTEATDGREAEAAMYAGEMEEAFIAGAVPMREVPMVVNDLDESCAYICDLVDEYEGTLDEQRFEKGGAPCANLFIDIPAANAAEFLSAAMHYDLSGAEIDGADYAEGGGDRVSLLLVLRSQQ